ncbi:LPS assembly lipoprotein LptE [bacterium]|nr:LPS assembly lipoprotein LptE [bacterium]MDC0279134.1 LPS assembly lipoprotein LptE [bacterium]
MFANNSLNRFRVLLVTGFLLLIFSGGCASYRYGAASMFRPGIKTVHVPVVQNETFRHDLGIRLSEALVKEIDRRTPYKVTGNPNADSTLVCTITHETKQILTETSDDDPRALDAVISAKATWTARNGEQLMHNSLAPNNDLSITFGNDSRFVPEAGQSMDTATQEAIEKLAARIVSQMEMRW